MNLANPKIGEEQIRIMIFGNPALVGMLKNPRLDVFLDAAFDCVPTPFLQCLIFMMYDHATSSYLPIMYALISSKCKEAYRHVFNQIVALLQWKINVRTYSTGYKMALMEQMDVQFGGLNGGTHHSCFFHLKQAWQRYLIKKCNMDSEAVTAAMKTGILDLLCVLPHDKVKTYRIPYLRASLAVGLTKKEHEKWEIFWSYFRKQWLPILSRWNISNMKLNDDISLAHYDMVNCTNNGLECYNCHFNALFPPKLSLLHFVKFLEEELRYQDSKLQDICHGRRKGAEHKETTIPWLPEAYLEFKDCLGAY
jgi:hypothetical protein